MIKDNIDFYDYVDLDDIDEDNIKCYVIVGEDVFCYYDYDDFVEWEWDMWYWVGLWCGLRFIYWLWN